jgi:probable HAF family extracellular repeat protein
MASTARTGVRGRLGVLIAASLVVTALTAATAAASAPSSVSPGLLLDNGRYTPVAIPRRLAATAPQGIVPTGINDRRQIVGEYIDDRLVSRGFLLDKHGRFTRIDVPGAKGTNAARINNRGQIVGIYSDTSPDLGDRPDSDPTAPTYKLRGFLLDRHGRLTRLDIPGARLSQAFGINDRGQVVGDYQDSDGKFHGYLWQEGRFTTIDVPGATATSVTEINNRGQLLGGYLDDRGRSHGVVLERGRYTTFDVPGAQVTFPLGLNDRGQIVGFGFDPADLTTIRGFLLAKGATGPLTPISRPGATTTAPFAINNRGQIVGAAETPAATSSPQPTDTPPMGTMA